MNKDSIMDKLVSFIIEASLILAMLFFIMASPILLAKQQNHLDEDEYNLIIDDIVCRGNQTTDCNFIIKKFYQNVGDTVDPIEISDARLRLGTLRQFKNIRIVLEKGSQRGHVNVVFIVDEADQIQYSISSGFTAENVNNFDGQSYFISSGITDYNFLGKGKELSLHVSHRRSDSEGDGRVINPNGQVLDFDIELKSKHSTLSATYYDPHFLDSKSYYLSTNIQYNNSSSENWSQITVNDELFTSNSKQDDDLSSLVLSVGRRFASHSFFEVSSVARESQSGIFDVTYGWDSRDDLVFPTQGTTFSIHAGRLNQKSRRSLSLRFNQYLSINDDWVFGYSFQNFAYYRPDRGSFDNTSSNAAINFTKFTHKDTISGNYSGWRFHANTPIHGPSDVSGVGASYIYQTDKLLMSFSLDYRFE